MKIAVGLLLLMTVAQAQYKAPTTKVIPAKSTGQVTRSEGRKIFAKAWASLQKGLKFKGENPVKIVGEGILTKNEVIEAINSLVISTSPNYKRSMRAIKFDAVRFRKDVPSSMASLVSKGFIAPYGPLTTGKNDGLSTREFGESVGIVLVRIADFTHMPTQFSPAMMPG
jgi:hypothetical protein